MSKADEVPGLLAMSMVLAAEAIREKEGRIPSREELWALVTDSDNPPPTPPSLLEMDKRDREAGVFDEQR